MILLERLEKIHQHHVPKQFDVSHLSEEVLNAPRVSNAPLRCREQQKIEIENEKMHKRLQNAKSVLSMISNRKQLALDADRHRYLAEQISKVARRRKARERCQVLAHEQHQHHARMTPQMVPVHTTFQLFGQGDDRHCKRGYEHEHECERERHGLGMILSGSKSLSRLDRNKNSSGFASHARLPQIHHTPADHHYGEKKEKSPSVSMPAHNACSPTLTNTTKLISALDLTSAFHNGFK